jgi:hypothetical protein
LIRPIPLFPVGQAVASQRLQDEIFGESSTYLELEGGGAVQAKADYKAAEARAKALK